MGEEVRIRLDSEDEVGVYNSVFLISRTQCIASLQCVFALFLDNEGQQQ